MALRQFIYCDDGLVDDFLEQLEGGRTDEVTRRERSEREGHGEVRAGIGPLGGGAGGVRSTSEEIEGVTKQTRASRFDRMYDLAVASADLDEPDLMTANAWESVRPRRLIALDVQISIPDASRILGMAGGLTGLVDIMKLVAPEQVDPQTEDIMNKISTIGEATAGAGTLSAVGVPFGTDLRLVMRLQRRYLLAQDELEGEATLVGKLSRKLKPGERELVLDLPGLSVMNREMRREMFDTADDSVSVEGPGGVIVPLAIFR